MANQPIYCEPNKYKTKMLELSDIVIALVLFLFLRFWWKTAQAREHAQTLAAKACAEVNAQLLDGSVALKKIRIERNKRKRYYLVRDFKFEFSCSRIERREGLISLCDTRQVSLFMDLPESPTYSIDQQ